MVFQLSYFFCDFLWAAGVFVLLLGFGRRGLLFAVGLVGW